jgi:hypothetical protein
MKEIYLGESYNLFLSNEDYIVKDKNNRSIFYSPKWVSNYRKLKECVEKLAELGEKGGRRDLIAEQIANTMDIYRESDVLEHTAFREIPREVKIEEVKYDSKIKKRLDTKELNRLANDIAEQNSDMPASDKVYSRIKHLLSESFSTEQVEKIMKIFKTSLLKGLVVITEDISPVAMVDRNPDLKEFCQKIIQSYYDQEDDIFVSSFEKKPDSERLEFSRGNDVPYRITTDGEKYYLEKKTGSSWKVSKKSESFANMQRVMDNIEEREQDKKDKKETARENKRVLRERRKEEAREKRLNKRS